MCSRLRRGGAYGLPCQEMFPDALFLRMALAGRIAKYDLQEEGASDHSRGEEELHKSGGCWGSGSAACVRASFALTSASGLSPRSDEGVECLGDLVGSPSGEPSAALARRRTTLSLDPVRLWRGDGPGRLGKINA